MSEMKRYAGTKTLHARPMTRGEYNAYRGWPTPYEENPTDEGYLVEYEDGGKANDTRHAGYISWSPKDVFERTYRLVGEGWVNPDSTMAQQIDPHKEKMLAFAIWVTVRDGKIRITTEEIEAMLAKFPGGPIVFTHGTQDTIELSLITPQKAQEIAAYEAARRAPKKQ